MLNFILWLIFGAVAGWLASIIMHTDEQQGAVSNIVIGIIGALLGGFLVSLFGGAGITGFNLWSLLVAVVGSVVLIAIIRAFRRVA